MNNILTTSVVMTTYNGEQFVYDQLYSLFKQTRKIDEVLIFDDGSTDNTVSIIETFINKNGLSNWKVFINKENKGWKRNFFEGMLTAKGDILFPCDQDDIWMDYKVDHMTKCFEENQNIDVLVGKYEKYFVGNDKNRPGLNWESAGLFVDKIENFFYKRKNTKEKLTIRKFDESFLQLEPGCCFAIRKSFLNEIKPFWFPDLGHDAFFTFFSELKGSYYRLNEIVIRWRHYAGSTSRPKSRSKTIRINEIRRNSRVLNMMKEYLIGNTNIPSIQEKLELVENAVQWNCIRDVFIDKHNILNGIKLLKYLKFYERYRAIITDWIYAFLEN